MHDRSPFRAIVFLLLVLAGAAAIGIGAYNAGVQHGFVEASRTAAVPPEGTPPVYVWPGRGTPATSRSSRCSSASSCRLRAARPAVARLVAAVAAAARAVTTACRRPSTNGIAARTSGWPVRRRRPSGPPDTVTR